MSSLLKTRLKSLPISKKLILLGSFLTVIGVFLPWYSDIDQFRTGDMFLGISGPMYLGGILVLIAGIISFGIVALKVMDKPVPKLPLEENHFHIFASSLSILMLVLTLSVYFHNKFGINLTDKDAGIGLILDFIGAAMVMLGAILSLRNKDAAFENIDESESLIGTLNDDRITSSLDKQETKIYDHGSMAVKNATQESIEDFTKEVEKQQKINDIRINE